MLRFDGKVVVVTGAGGGIGKQYALFFASRGAKVVVNDLGASMKGDATSNSSSAQMVVDEIKAKGGVAVANGNSVTEGEKIIKTAMDNFGRVDIVINNAGILRDISFQKMTEKDWDLVIAVHLKGTYSVSKAAWNIMREQNFGRIVNTSSASGLYGSFGQANYSAAKLGIHGLTQTLAKEGEKRNIFVNSIAPVAASRMTETVLPKDVLENLKPEYVVPLVAYLSHPECKENGQVFELGAGVITKLRWQRSEGGQFDLPFTVEDVKSKIEQISNFDKNCDYPQAGSDIFEKFTDNLDRIKGGKSAPISMQPQKKAAAPTQPASNLKSERIFEMMRVFLDRGEGKPLIKKVDAIYNFCILAKKGGKVVKTWTIDLKNGQGKVEVKAHPKPDSTFTMIDLDFEKVCLGKLNPQNAFLQGKMKIKGNMKKATLFTPELFPPPTEQNIAKYLNSKL